MEIAEIVAHPDLHAEAKAACHALAVRAAGAGEHAVRQALQPLVLVYGVGEAARSPAFWQAYKVLASVPAEALHAGIQDYLAQPDSQFFPKPGPLKALCDKHAEPIFKAAARASRAASLAPLKVYALSPEQKAEVHRMARDCAETLRATSERMKPGRIPSESLPSIAGKTDETGITPELRAVMDARGWFDRKPAERD